MRTNDVQDPAARLKRLIDSCRLQPLPAIAAQAVALASEYELSPAPTLCTTQEWDTIKRWSEFWTDALTLTGDNSESSDQARLMKPREWIAFMGPAFRALTVIASHPRMFEEYSHIAEGGVAPLQRAIYVRLMHGGGQVVKMVRDATAVDASAVASAIMCLDRLTGAWGIVMRTQGMNGWGRRELVMSACLWLHAELLDVCKAAQLWIDEEHRDVLGGVSRVMSRLYELVVQWALGHEPTIAEQLEQVFCGEAFEALTVPDDRLAHLVEGLRLSLRERLAKGLYRIFPPREPLELTPLAL